MKKKILCLLLALAVVMSVVPLTAFAELTVPEEYRGTYEKQGLNGNISVVIDQYKIEIDAPEQDINNLSWPINHVDADGSVYFSYDEGSLEYVHVYINGDYLCVDVFRDERWHFKHFVNLYFNIASDPTNSTLSTGSNWIIPVAVGVLALGAVIYIGKGKRRKEND